MHKKIWIFAAAALFSLSACLDTNTERGLFGAAAGAVTANALGGDPVVGAAVGGAAGYTCQHWWDAC
jgi:osmotically inducible lipoprotein OsmB